MSGRTPTRYRFGDIEVDLAAARVRKGGLPLDLEPLTYRVLLHLVEHRDRVVTKEELVDAIWRVKFVSDNALTRQIAALRAALGDDARSPSYIETAHALGYRFIAPIEEVGPHEPAFSTGSGASRRRGVWAAGGAIVVGAAAALLVALSTGRVDRSAAAAPPVMRQLTADAGHELYPALSPDGTVLAYSSDRSGSFEIYLRTLEGSGDEVQVTRDGAGNAEATWSPDGQHLAYFSQERGGIWVIPSLGGAARRLTRSGSHPSWSPDGRWIAYQSDSGIAVTEETRVAQPPGTLWMAPAEGGEPRRLTEPGVPSGGHAQPRWSPDGRYLVFASQDVGTGGAVWALSIADGRLERVSPEETLMLEGVFTRDGRAVIAAGGGDMARNLWRIPWLADRGVAGGPPEPLVPARARLLEPFPDGRRILLTLFERKANIWEVPVDLATGAARGPARPLTRETAIRNSRPRFSPDGSTVACFSQLPGNPPTIWLLDPSGASRRAVPQPPASSGSAHRGVLTSVSWFPDGRSLAVFRFNRPTIELARLDVETGAVTPLRPLEAGWQWVDLSPDGSQIAFHLAVGATRDIWLAPTTGGPARRLTVGEELVGFPRWSPDGRWLAVQLQRGDDIHAAVVASDGGELRQLTSEPGAAWVGGWSPDGRFVSFVHYSGGSSNVYTVEVATGALHKVTDFTTRRQNVRSSDWSPSGDRIVFEHRTIGADLWLMELPRADAFDD